MCVCVCVCVCVCLCVCVVIDLLDDSEGRQTLDPMAAYGEHCAVGFVVERREREEREKGERERRERERERGEKERRERERERKRERERDLLDDSEGSGHVLGRLFVLREWST